MTSSERSVPYYGDLNAHIIGRILRDIVRDTMGFVFDRRMDFETHGKVAYDGISDDVFSDVDVAAQKYLVEHIHECFPTWGIIGEEAVKGPNGEKQTLHIPCTNPHHDIYVTIDPIDGTKAFTRMQTTGFSVMLALVMDGEVIAVVIGDVMGGDMFYYRPESDKVHRTHWKGQRRYLEHGVDTTLAASYALTKKPQRDLASPMARAMLASPEDEGLFGGFDTASGSIGLAFAQMWIGAFKGVLLSPGARGVMHDTAWDSTPVIGISRKLGYKFFRINDASGTVEAYEPELPGPEPIPMTHDIVIVHERHEAELQAWAQSYRDR